MYLLFQQLMNFALDFKTVNLESKNLEEINIKKALRSGAGTDELKEIIQKAVNIKREQHNLDGRLAPDTDDRPMCQIGG